MEKGLRNGHLSICAGNVCHPILDLTVATMADCMSRQGMHFATVIE